MVKETDFEIIFVTDWYDGPLKGLCRYKGKIEKFKLSSDFEDDEWEYDIILLNPWQRMKALLDKWKFEIFVGTHWTFKNGKRVHFYHVRQPKWLHDFLFRIYYRMK